MEQAINQKQVRLNGQWTTTVATRLTDLLTSIGVDPAAKGVAVAMNGEVVLRSSWPNKPVNEGDHVEILRPVQGG